MYYVTLISQRSTLPLLDERADTNREKLSVECFVSVSRHSNSQLEQQMYL